MAGVGGMGCGVATTILVRAGHKEGHDVLFLDKKGLAIRNGGVVSQVSYNVSGKPTTAIIPYGKADLLIGLDILEAARTIDPTGRARISSPDRTTVVVNTDKTTTIPELLSGRETFDPNELEQIIRNNTSIDDFLARNISRICQKYLGSKIYANIMMLGFAFQKGLIPVSMHSMAWAIKDTIRADFRKNLYAFNMGRKLVIQPDLFLGAPKRATWQKVLEGKCRCTIRRYRQGQRMSEALREMSASVMETVVELDEADKQAIVVRLYDLLRWGGPDYAMRYVRALAETYKKDTADFDFAATRAVIGNLADAMLIKDGVFLAELSTSHEKYARDREKYDVNPANGDKISYRHLWHWKMKIGPWKWNMSMTVYDWMLHILKHSRYLRKLLPGWHKDKYEFLRKYESLVAKFAYTTDEEYQRQLVELSSARCMDCLNPKCQEAGLMGAGCPLESQIPQWVELARQERWREAAEKLFETNNFPEITSRICPASCESECKQNFGGFAVGIRDIERRIADRALTEGWVTPDPAAKKTGKTVAIVGSGPAGLAAAQQLARAGHDVTVFETEARPGGLMRYGIPPGRLEKELIDRRIEQLSSEGVKFRTSVEIGKDISAAELKKQFDAVLLAIGAAQPRDLKIPGREIRGVQFGIEFLRNGNIGADAGETASVKNKVVAVIGGGLTGEDCVEVAIAQGAKEVHQLEILPASAKTKKLPQTDVIEPSNVHRRWCVSTKAFGGDGNLASLQAVEVAWKPSVNGPVMESVGGSDFQLNVDVALLAMGFDPVVPTPIAEQLGLATDEYGGISTKSFATGVAGVFAAGDLVTGASYVATSIASGRKASEKIDEYLAKS
ncbi:MAG: FAD-dependent oxidoreductase [Phycisphaerae bacterium]|nr:FAD-dependent oxidoreductase [Phycisphaerae bacterium]